MSTTIATTPASASGISYAVSIVDEGPAKVEWLRLEILIAGNVYRSLLIDAYALEGIIQCLEHAATLRETARTEASAAIERVKGGQP
jgi:hypothetical protein